MSCPDYASTSLQFCSGFLKWGYACAYLRTDLNSGVCHMSGFCISQWTAFNKRETACNIRGTTPLSEKVGGEKNRKKKVDIAGVSLCRGIRDSWIDQSYDLRETQLPKPLFRCLCFLLEELYVWVGVLNILCSLSPKQEYIGQYSCPDPLDEPSGPVSLIN